MPGPIARDLLLEAATTTTMTDEVLLRLQEVTAHEAMVERDLQGDDHRHQRNTTTVDMLGAPLLPVTMAHRREGTMLIHMKLEALPHLHEGTRALPKE